MRQTWSTAVALAQWRRSRPKYGSHIETTGEMKHIVRSTCSISGCALTVPSVSVCATALRFANYPLAPLLIGFILGGMLENNFSRAMQLYDGVSFIWERPMTLGLLIIAVVLVVLPSYRARRAQARQAGVADGD